MKGNAISIWPVALAKEDCKNKNKIKAHKAKMKIQNHFLATPNGPELSCGDVQPVPCRIYARQASPFPKKFFARGKIIDGYFRQLERLVRRHQLLFNY